MDEIINFILNNVKSLLLGLIFLILGLLFLPSSWILGVIRKIRPKIIDNITKPFKYFLNTIMNLYINNSFIDINKKNTTFNERTEYLLKQNKLIEKNIYVIDLCKDIVSMFGYIYQNENMSYVFEQAVYYLQHYSNLIESIDQDKNFIDNFLLKTNQLSKAYSIHDENENITNMIHKFYIDEIFIYLTEERKKLNVLLDNNKKELVVIVKEEVNVL
jgi:hypothetical protein